MINTWHILRKEMRNYFNSPIAYVFLAMFLLIVGFFFFIAIVNYQRMVQYASMQFGVNQNFNSVDRIITPFFNLMSFLLIFMIPVVTMRLFSEEKKLGTMELLFTYPLTEGSMVLGKFLASAVILIIIYIFSFSYIIIYNNFFEPAWGVVLSGYLGLLLIGVAFLSFGMWVSSLFADQVTSALFTVGGLLIFWIIGSGAVDVTGTTADILQQLSIVEHFQNFSRGIIDSHDIVYFACFIGTFIFLTIQGLEVRKWKG